MTDNKADRALAAFDQPLDGQAARQLLHEDFTPEAEVIDLSRATTFEKKVVAQQVAFLQAYARCGTILRACVATGVHRRSVYNWKNANRYGFADRMAMAEHVWAERLEDGAYERLANPFANGRIGSDGLYSHALNANLPKWRGPQPASDERVGEVMKAIIKLAHNKPDMIEGKPKALDTPSPR